MCIGIRQRRLAAMKKHEQKKKKWLELGHGEYSELANEVEFFEACKKSQNVVVHFYREETMRQVSMEFDIYLYIHKRIFH